MQQHRAKIGVVFLIVFIDLVGFGIVIPFLPLYAEDFGPSPVVFGLLMASFSIILRSLPSLRNPPPEVRIADAAIAEMAWIALNGR